MANEIVAWVEKKVGPPAEILEDAAAVADFIDASEVVVVGFFEDQERKPIHLTSNLISTSSILSLLETHEKNTNK